MPTKGNIPPTPPQPGLTPGFQAGFFVKKKRRPASSHPGVLNDVIVLMTTPGFETDIGIKESYFFNLKRPRRLGMSCPLWHPGWEKLLVTQDQVAPRVGKRQGDTKRTRNSKPGGTPGGRTYS